MKVDLVHSWPLSSGHKRPNFTAVLMKGAQFICQGELGCWWVFAPLTAIPSVPHTQQMPCSP